MFCKVLYLVTPLIYVLTLCIIMCTLNADIITNRTTKNRSFMPQNPLFSILINSITSKGRIIINNTVE